MKGSSDETAVTAARVPMTAVKPLRMELQVIRARRYFFHDLLVNSGNQCTCAFRSLFLTALVCVFLLEEYFFEGLLMKYFEPGAMREYLHRTFLREM